MDACETWAYEYLKFLGIPEGEIMFEPNGTGTFPDFQVKGTIGVEVRRLNQYMKNAAGEWVPLEELARPLEKRLVKILQAFGSPKHGATWHVFYGFQRPQKTAKWELILKEKLTEFLKAPQPQCQTSVIVDDHFKLELLRRSSPLEDRTFILGGTADYDSGGFVDTELQTSLEIAIQEKTAKRIPHRSKYNQWWLILIDQMLAGAQGEISVDHDWDKVIVVFPKAYLQAYEIPRVCKAE